MSVSSPCPRCAVPTLARADHDGRTMLACTRCAGVWLDDVDAQGLLAPLTDLHERTAAYPPVPCPRCGDGMPAQYSAMANVEVDRCRAHGVWFDRDEVAHIAHAIARLRGEPPPALPEAYAHGSSMALGAAVVGVAVGAASVALDSASGAQSQPQSTAGGSVDAGGVVEAALLVPEGLATEGAAAAVEAAGEAAGGAVEVAGEVASGAVEAISSVDAGELASGALEVGGSVLEGAGEILGAVLGGIAEALGGL